MNIDRYISVWSIIAVAILGIAPFAADNHKEYSSSIFLSCAVLTTVCIVVIIRGYLSERWGSPRMVPLICVVSSGLLFSASLAWYMWPTISFADQPVQIKKTSGNVNPEKEREEKAMASDNSKPTYSMGDITNNQGIVTQGQVGNNTIVNQSPPRESDGLYQSDRLVGNVHNPHIDEKAGIIQFDAVGFNTFPDPNKNIEYQNFILQCDSMPTKPKDLMFAGRVSMTVVGFECKIVGRK